MLSVFKRAKPEIVAGMRLRESGEAPFGAPKRRIWVVAEVWRDHDGHRYARLRDEGDHTVAKTVSVSAVQNLGLFVPLAARAGEVAD